MVRLHEPKTVCSFCQGEGHTKISCSRWHEGWREGKQSFSQLEMFLKSLFLQAKKDMFRKMIAPLIGKETAKLHKREIVMKNLPNLPSEVKAKTPIPF